MRKFKKNMSILFITLLLISLSIYSFTQTPKFGKNPSGAYLERVKKSPNYKDGEFKNLSNTPTLTGGATYSTMLYDMLFAKKENIKPTDSIKTNKTELKELDANENLIVWLGHSSYYMQLEGKKLLIDPVLVSASPVGFFGKAFSGSATYSPNDIPKVDYLIITHDHWDHLDYATIKKIRHDSLQVFCPLGVGSHFRHWGFMPSQIEELDWFDSISICEPIELFALPARHFSGRGFARNKTLWASFLLKSPIGNIYLSGDGGYDSHYKAIKEQFNEIHFAVLENGQYNYKWANIHLMPKELKTTVEDLAPKRFITGHNSKYALAQHNWQEPMESIFSYTENDSIKLLTPMIGEKISLDSEEQVFNNAWWR